MNCNVLRSLAVVCLSALVSLVCLESFLRLYGDDDRWFEVEKANVLRNVTLRYAVGEAYGRKKGLLEYSRNEFGLRDRCEKPEDVKILTVGASTTDQRYLDLPATFQSVLERELGFRPSNNSCVSNAGVDGHSSWGHMFSFENWFPLIPKLRPQYITLYVGLADADFRRAKSGSSYDRRNDNQTWEVSLKALLKELRLVQGLLPLYRYALQSLDDDRPIYASHNPREFVPSDFSAKSMHPDTVDLSGENAEAFRSRLKILLGEVENIGSEVICITQPHSLTRLIDGRLRGLENVLGTEFNGLDFDYSLRELNKVIAEECGNSTLDLYNFDFEPHHFYDGVHTNPAGSLLIGKAIAVYIKEKAAKVIPPH